jgi:hypothetical protein
VVDEDGYFGASYDEGYSYDDKVDYCSSAAR